MALLSTLPVAAASSAGIYIATADSLGGGYNNVTRVAFGDYSTTQIYQGAAVNKPYAIALDTTEAKAFTVLNDTVGQRVVAIDLNNGGTTAIAATETSGAGRSISGLALDWTNKVVYFATAASLVATDNKIQRVNYDGSVLTTIYTSGGNTRKPQDLAVDHGNGKLFIVFSDRADSWISVAGLDGGNLAEVTGTHISGSGITIGGLVLDTVNGFLYYTVTGSLASENNRIYRGKYDGSDLKLLYSGNLYDKPSFLALDQSNNIHAAFTGSGYQMVKSASLDNTASMVWTPMPNTLFSSTGASITGITVPAAQLSATTSAATSVSDTIATLNGTVNANGNSATVSFEYGLDTSYGISATASQSPVTGSSDTAVSAVISGLTCNTPYHFRVKAESSSGTVIGNDQSFTTSSCPTYTVTYNGNGNTGGSAPSDSNAYLFGTTVTVLDNTGALVKTGYTFAGWNTTANGSGTAYAAGATFGITENTILYAQWTPDTCGGGSCLPPTVTAISPTSGTSAGGTLVTITGSELTGATAVKFGSANAAGYTVDSATRITAISPAAVAGLIADIIVITPGGTSAAGSADQFTYTQDQAMNFTTGTSYARLATALAEALTSAEIRAFDSQFDGNFILNKGITLKGGYDATFLISGSNPTTLNGSLTVQSGNSAAKTLVVRGKLAIQGGSLRVDNVKVQI